MKSALTAVLSAVVIAGALAASAGSALAAGADDLLRFVPSKAALVVSIDHTKLGKHPHYKALLGFMEGQRWLAGVSNDSATGMAAGEHVQHSVTFRMANDKQGAVLSGKLDAAKIQEAAKKALGDKFESGDADGAAWFMIDKRHAAVDLGKGKILIFEKGLMDAVAPMAATKAKSITGRSGFSGLKKRAAKGKPPVWAVAFVPKKTRDRLTKQGSADMAHVEKVIFTASGKADMTLNVEGLTKEEAGATEVAAALNGKIERKILSSTVLSALGVAALARRVEIKAKGKAVVGKMTLTEAQVGLLAQVGGRILSALN